MPNKKKTPIKKQPILTKISQYCLAILCLVKGCQLNMIDRNVKQREQVIIMMNILELIIFEIQIYI